jgi:acyl-CoA hydrolase
VRQTILYDLSDVYISLPRILVGVLALLADMTGNYRKIPTMLADYVEKNSLQGKMKYSLLVGASSGAETENRWAALNMIERRSPHQVGKQIAKGINNSEIKFFDKHLSMFPVDLVYVSSSSTCKRPRY